jgi:hypothetical protein
MGKKIACLGALLFACQKPAPLPPLPQFEANLEQAVFRGGTNPEALRMASLRVEATTHGVAVTTQLSLRMTNTGDATEEAILRVPIPPGAAVTRAILYMGDRPMDGVFVDRRKADAIYRTITGLRKDPALVAWDGDAWLAVNVYPLAPGETRRLDLDWVEPIAEHRGRGVYRVPVVADGAGRVFRPDAVVVDGRTVALQGRAFVPLRPGPKVAVATGAGGKLVFSFADEAAVPKVVLLVGTTGDAAPELSQRRAWVASFLEALPPTARVSLIAADWEARVLAEGEAPGAVLAKLPALATIPPAGDLDVGHALDLASAVAVRNHAHRLVWIGDSQPAMVDPDLAGRFGRLARTGMGIAVVGESREESSLRTLVAGVGGLGLATLEGGNLPRLLTWLAPPRAGQDPSASGPWFPLWTVTGEIRWLARLEEAPATPATLVPAERLEALYARAQADAPGGPKGGAGIVTPMTSLLVLEHQADYARWGLPLPNARSAPREDRVSRKPEDPSRQIFLSALGNVWPQLVACYAQALRAQPNLGGEVYMTLRMDGRGKVAITSWEDHLTGKAANRCLQRRIRAWVFPLKKQERGLYLRLVPVILEGKPVVLGQARGEAWSVGQEILRLPEPMPARLAKLVTLFKDGAGMSAEAFTWWLKDRVPGPDQESGYFFLARLFHAQDKDRDALRVLSEIVDAFNAEAVKHVVADFPASPSLARFAKLYTRTNGSRRLDIRY